MYTPTLWHLMHHLPYPELFAMLWTTIVFGVACGILLAWVVAWTCRLLARHLDERKNKERS